MLFDMNKPRPVTSKDFEANVENSCGNMSGSVGVAVSLAIT
jgi:hypothetical protein